MPKKSVSKVPAAAYDRLSVKASPLLILSILSDAAEILSKHTRVKNLQWHGAPARGLDMRQ